VNHCGGTTRDPDVVGRGGGPTPRSEYPPDGIRANVCLRTPLPRKKHGVDGSVLRLLAALALLSTAVALLLVAL